MQKFFTTFLALMATISVFAAHVVGDKIEQNFGTYSLFYQVSKVGTSNEVCLVPQNASSPFYLHKPTGDIVIPATITDEEGVEYKVKRVDQYAFFECDGVTSVEVSAEIITTGAFKGCGLSSLVINEGVANIAKGAFSNCPNLTGSLSFPTSLRYFYGGSFESCNITTCSVAASNKYFKSIDGMVCSKDGKTIVYCGKNNPNVSNLDLTQFTTVSDYAFYECKTLPDSLYVPELTIGDRAFHASNVSVVYFDGTNSGSNSFQLCPFKKVILGKNFVKLGQLTINSGVIKEIYIKSTSIPNWEYNSDYSYASIRDNMGTYSKAKVYVQCGMADAYKADTKKWGNFSDIEEMMLFDVNVSAENGSVVKEEGSNCSEIKLTVKPQAGYSFVRWSDGNTSNPRILDVTDDVELTAICSNGVGINETSSDAVVFDYDSPTYNVLGQRVDARVYKGVVLQKGRKYIINMK